MQKMELRYWWDHVIKESTNELVEWKLLVDIVGIKSAYLKDKIIFSRVLRLSEMPRCMERPRIATCCLEWLGRLKLTSDWFGCVLFIPFYVAKVLELFTKSSSCFTCLYIYIYFFLSEWNNESVCGSVSQLFSWSASHSACQSVSQSVSLPVSQLVSRSVCQLFI